MADALKAEGIATWNIEMAVFPKARRGGPEKLTGVSKSVDYSSIAGR